MYGAENIVWIKNVKRQRGMFWAYENAPCDGTFLLNWSTQKKNSAATPGVGDIIVLFQRPNFVNGRANKVVYFTHLVSPISVPVVEDYNTPSHKWCREVRLIAKPDPIASLPNPGYFNFFLPNRGLTNPIINLTNNLGLTEAQTQTHIWQLFQPFICNSIRNQIYQSQHPVGIYGEIEGDTFVAEHIRVEQRLRNAAIVERKKALALRVGNGAIQCEGCNFDFYAKYGMHGYGFIECHHRIHLAEGVRMTRLEDLALVCSNCHRMLHRRKSDGTYFTVEELRVLIATQ